MALSKIEWTEETWNPVTGCTKISDGCLHCYAEVFSRRLKAMGVSRYANGFIPTVHEELIDLPTKWTKPRKIFVNSMSDLFHEAVSDDIILKVFNTMNRCPQHQFQVLTKRPERLAQLNDRINWTTNIWMGVTIENNNYVNRADLLRKTGARIKFISAEPLLNDLVDLNLSSIQWIIVGGESGPGARPMLEEWVIRIRDSAHNNNVAFFFKQWGGVRKHKSGRLLQGETYDEYPTS